MSKHRVCTYKHKIACQGIPETLFVTIQKMFIFMFEKNASGSQGEWPLTSF